MFNNNKLIGRQIQIHTFKWFRLKNKYFKNLGPTDSDPNSQFVGF